MQQSNDKENKSSSSSSSDTNQDEVNEQDRRQLPQLYRGIDLSSSVCAYPAKRAKREYTNGTHFLGPSPKRWAELPGRDTMNNNLDCQMVAKSHVIGCQSRLKAYHTEFEERPALMSETQHEDVSILRSTYMCRFVSQDTHTTSMDEKWDEHITHLFDCVDTADQPTTPFHSNNKPNAAALIRPCISECTYNNSISSSSPGNLDEVSKNSKYGVVDMSDDEIFAIWFKMFEKRSDSRSRDSSNGDCYSRNGISSFRGGSP